MPTDPRLNVTMTEGRRRADVRTEDRIDYTALAPTYADPAIDLLRAGRIADEVAASAEPRDTMGPASPIPAALDHARDRMARTDAILDDLASTIARLATVLEPVLTDGSPAPYPVDPNGGTPEAGDVDRRSTIARSIGDLAAHAHQQGDYAGDLIRRVAAITEAVEA